MGCCIAAALIASQGLTLSSRVRNFLRLWLGLAHFRLSWNLIAVVTGAEFLLLGALFQFEFGSVPLHADHFLAIAKSANLFAASPAEFPLCSGTAPAD